MKRQTLAQACCTTPSAICFWAAIFLLVYGSALLLGTLWPSLLQYGDTLILAAMGAACSINFIRNRTVHCAITGPLFLAGAAVAFLIEAGGWTLNQSALWGVMLVGIGSAFLVEWRLAGGQSRASNA